MACWVVNVCGIYLGLVAMGEVQAAAVTRVSTLDTGAQAAQGGTDVSISADGRIVLFRSRAALTPDSVDDLTEKTYLRTVETGVVTYLKALPTPETDPADSANNDRVLLAGDGAHVAFESSVRLTADDTNDVRDVFVLDVATSTISRATLPDGVAAPADAARLVGVSHDATFVAFESAGSYVAADTNNVIDVYVRHRTAGKTARASIPDGDTPTTPKQTTLPVRQAVLSANGYNVAFVSDEALVSNDLNNTADVYLRFLGDEVKDAGLSRISVGADTKEITVASLNPRISADGNLVAFETAGAFSTQDLNGEVDVYARDTESNQTVLISADDNGVAAGPASAAAVSADGRYVAFTSPAAFDPGDTDTVSDVYLVHAATRKRFRVSEVQSGAPGGAGVSNNVSIGANGQRVAFSTAGALVADDTNGVSDVYLRSPTLSIVSPADGSTVNDIVSVRVEVSGTVVGSFDARIRFLVDGVVNSAQATEAPATFILGALCPGPHTLEVALIDGTGEITPVSHRITVHAADSNQSLCTPESTGNSSGGGGGGAIIHFEIGVWSLMVLGIARRQRLKPRRFTR